MHQLQSSLLLTWTLLLLSPLSAFSFVINTSQRSTYSQTGQQRIQSTSNDAAAAASETALAKALEPLKGNRQKAWLHAKKPLLRIGGKGATKTHGNSLRELLDQHTVVKVKVNTGPYDGSLESAFEALKILAVESGADAGLELIHIKTSENTILFGKEGALDSMDAGDFPPPPKEEKEEKAAE